MWHINPAKPIFRALFALLGFVFLSLGLAALKTPLLSYRNWWGGLIFAPFVILFGLVIILGALFKPKIFR